MRKRNRRSDRTSTRWNDCHVASEELLESDIAVLPYTITSSHLKLNQSSDKVQKEKKKEASANNLSSANMPIENELVTLPASPPKGKTVKLMMKTAYEKFVHSLESDNIVKARKCQRVLPKVGRSMQQTKCNTSSEQLNDSNVKVLPYTITTRFRSRTLENVCDEKKVASPTKSNDLTICFLNQNMDTENNCEFSKPTTTLPQNLSITFPNQTLETEHISELSRVVVKTSKKKNEASTSNLNSRDSSICETDTSENYKMDEAVTLSKRKTNQNTTKHLSKSAKKRMRNQLKKIAKEQQSNCATSSNAFIDQLPKIVFKDLSTANENETSFGNWNSDDTQLNDTDNSENERSVINLDDTITWPKNPTNEDTRSFEKSTKKRKVFELINSEDEATTTKKQKVCSSLNLQMVDLTNDSSYLDTHDGDSNSSVDSASPGNVISLNSSIEDNILSNNKSSDLNENCKQNDSICVIESDEEFSTIPVEGSSAVFVSEGTNTIIDNSNLVADDEKPEQVSELARNNEKSKQQKRIEKAKEIFEKIAKKPKQISELARNNEKSQQQKRIKKGKEIFEKIAEKPKQISELARNNEKSKQQKRIEKSKEIVEKITALTDAPSNSNFPCQPNQNNDDHIPENSHFNEDVASGSGSLNSGLIEDKILTTKEGADLNESSKKEDPIYIAESDEEDLTMPGKDSEVVFVSEVTNTFIDNRIIIVDDEEPKQIAKSPNKKKKSKQQKRIEKARELSIQIKALRNAASKCQFGPPNQKVQCNPIQNDKHAAPKSRWDPPNLNLQCNPTQNDELREIVIDGSNVAFGHSNNKYFSVHGLQLAIMHFVKKGHKVKAFVPQFRQSAHECSNPAHLQELGNQGLVLFTPSRVFEGSRITPYDDRFIVEYAHLQDAVILSNDNYRDILQEHPEWRRTIQNNILMYTWADDILLLPNDPLGRYGPKLDIFLRKITIYRK